MSTKRVPEPSMPRPVFERGTGFLLSRLGLLASRSWAAFLAQHQLTLTQYVALVVLDEQGAQGQVRLAQLVAIDARNLVAVLDSLAARGLVARTVDPADGRRRVVTLTRQGKELVAKLASGAASDRGEFLGALTTVEQGQLNELLQRLFDAHTADS